LKNLITDKPAPITVALAQKTPASKTLLQLEKSDKHAPGKSMLVQLSTLPDDIQGLGSVHTTMSTSHISVNGRTASVPSNGDTIPHAGVIVHAGDSVTSAGIEEADVYGQARVGGTAVLMNQG
tara:strand:+ start:139 stop:507 length:369 start_codon:yes stop_codon:yes gene_type:complete